MYVRVHKITYCIHLKLLTYSITCRCRLIDRCQASCIAVTCAIAFMLSRDPEFYRGDECDVKAVRDAAFSEAKQCFAGLELEAV